jgi:hypothetical protein
MKRLADPIKVRDQKIEKLINLFKNGGRRRGKEGAERTVGESSEFNIEVVKSIFGFN